MVVAANNLEFEKALAARSSEGAEADIGGKQNNETNQLSKAAAAARNEERGGKPPQF